MNNFLNVNLGDNKCTSCMACYAACPVKAIEIVIDKKGFYSPSVNKDKCINCGLCQKICPVVNNTIYKNEVQEIYACTNKEEQVRLRSSSGGIFSALANYVLANNGYVCGAILDKNLHLYHKVSNSIRDIEDMRGSKYIQSYTGNCYNEIKTLLDDNITVLFCGTPCQCIGLKAYLQKRYENLIIVDLLCTCVNPQYLLKEHVKNITGEFYNNIKVNFRDKITGWGGNPQGGEFSFSLEWEDNNGKQYKFYDYLYDDDFFKGFLSHIWMKDSCEKCSYSSSERVSDFTLGDFWNIGLKEEYKELNDNRGLSFVKINTNKAKKIFAELHDRLKIKKIVDYDWALTTQCAINGKAYQKHKNTDKFFEYAPRHYSPIELTKDLLGINQVGILTYDFSINYGANLQTYATCEKIKQLGFSPKIIRYAEHYYKTLGFEDDNLKQFRDKYLPRSEVCFTEKDLSAEISNCNKIIIGGDQVFRNWWNREDRPFLRYYGDFVYGKRTLASYGSSFGVSFANGTFEIINECQKLLSRFDKISVRENSGIKILKETFNIEGTEVLDPVFLLNTKDYETLINNCTDIYTTKEYIGYMILSDKLGLGDICKELQSTLQGCNIININKNANGKYNTVEQWLNYIKNADFIITDSFHCIAFCIIFQKPFVVVSRSFGGNARIVDFLNKFGLANCFKESMSDITSEDLKNDFDWCKINKILDKERILSIKYLLDILLLEPSTKIKYSNEKIENIREKYEAVYAMNKRNAAINSLKQHQKEQLKIVLQKDLIKRKYFKYKILSKILFGKKREHYKEKAKLYKEKIDQIRNIMESF